MNHAVELTNAIASLLATEVKAQDLPKACVGFGLADGTDEDAFRGKARYISTRLEGKDLDELMGIGAAVLATGALRCQCFSCVRLYDTRDPKVSTRSRRSHARIFAKRSPLSEI